MCEGFVLCVTLSFSQGFNKEKAELGMHTLLQTKHVVRQPHSLLPSCRNLADMDSDGKMDRLEFSIAMKLIKLTLQGRNLPATLPMIMKQSPVSSSASTLSSSARFGKTT